MLRVLFFVIEFRFEYTVAGQAYFPPRFFSRISEKTVGIPLEMFIFYIHGFNTRCKTEAVTPRLCAPGNQERYG